MIYLIAEIFCEHEPNVGYFCFKPLIYKAVDTA